MSTTNATQTTETLKLDGMSCGHCVRAVEETLSGLDGVSVHDVAIGHAKITYDPATIQRSTIADALDEEGYAVV